MTKTEINKELMQVATHLHGSAPNCQDDIEKISLPEKEWDEAKSLLGKLRMSVKRGWYAAAKQLRQELTWAIRRVRENLSATEQLLKPPPRPTILVGLGDIYADLVALSNEFEDVKWNIEKKTISVITDRIELKGMDFGQFEICLHWDLLDSGSAYKAIALQPNPAASHPHVTHPHVSEGHVCEGEGEEAIQNSLDDGRLLDFFLLVRGVLTTYNDQSPYVSIDNWEGHVCPDCDATIVNSELRSCEECEHDACSNCLSSCYRCGDYLCSECQQCCTNCGGTACAEHRKICADCEETVCMRCAGGPCKDCGEYTCKDCRSICADCLKNVCNHCRKENQTEDRCKVCHEAKLKSDAEPESEPEGGSGDPECSEPAEVVAVSGSVVDDEDDDCDFGPDCEDDADTDDESNEWDNEDDSDAECEFRFFESADGSDDEDEEIATTGPETAVHPDGVVETTVST